MATDLRLSIGDGDVTDDLLLDAVVGYTVRNGTFSAPYIPGARYRLITWTEDVYGTSGDDLWVKVGALNAKLKQAAEAQSIYGHGSRLTLSMKWNATNYVYADVIGGYIDVLPESWTGSAIDAAYLPYIAVSLVAEPYFRGAPVTTTVSTTITATAGTFAIPGGSGSGGLFIDDIPGDVPALMRHKIEDVSTSGKFINRVRIGSFSLRDALGTVAQSAFTPWIDDTTSGAGVATAGADAVGGFYSSLTLAENIQRVAHYLKPAATYMTGLFDVWLRCRDSNTLLGAPSLSAAGVDNDANMYIRQVITGGSASSATQTPTWGSATRGGSALLLGVGLNSRTITITTPTGWTAGPALAHASAACRVAWFYINPGASRSGAETVTLSGAVKNGYAMYEVVGAAFTTPVDVVPTAEGSSSSLAVASGTLSQAREMLFGIWATPAIGSPAVTGFTDPTMTLSNTTYDVVSGYARSTTTTTGNLTSSGLSASGNCGALISLKQAQNLAPNIPIGTYEIAVVAASAGATSLSEPSQTAIVQVTQTDSVIYAEWTPGTGTADHWRIQYRLGAGAWEYYASAAATGALTAYTVADDGGTAGDPPDVPNATLVYLLFALSSGAQTFFTKPVPVELGGSSWEWLYLGCVPLPPMPAADGEAPRDWIAYVEAKNTAGSGTFDADALVLMPHPLPSADNRHQMHVEYKNTNLSALRRWNIGTPRNGATYAYLSTVGTDTEQGQLVAIGDSMGGPGPTWLTLVPDVAGGASDVVDCKVTWEVTYIPRYLWPRGS